jgi:hypothetical protein
MFLAADKLRKNLEPSDYKHVALGLIFLKHISNAFEAKRAALFAEDPSRRRGPGRVSGGDRVLGAEGGALVAPASQCTATDHRQADRRRNGRHREGQSRPQGRSSKGL